MKLNPKQLEAVTMPLDANFRVMAGPGSGKTSGVIVPRYIHLVENGINPESILVVAFNKTMATELITRIKLPDLSPKALSQICTINAFCYRELCNHWHQTGNPRLSIFQPGNGGKNPHFQMDAIIDKIYGQGEKPTKKEVFIVIDNFKAKGLGVDMAADYFSQALGLFHGQKMTDIYVEYQSFMQSQNSMDFVDQLYLFERLLIESFGFRVGIQSRISHVLVDEAQDVSEQALRILLTVSQEPRWNEVYDMKG